MKKAIKIILFAEIFFIFLILIMFTPQTYKKGIDYEVGTYKIPLYAKLAGFIYRDYEYRSISFNITKGLNSGEDKILAIYNWTVDHIKDAPEDLPIVDDHILNIIIRGYGEADQMADVFTTLCAQRIHRENISRHLSFLWLKSAVDGLFLMCVVTNIF